MSEDETNELLIRNANNFGPAPDMYHPDYGWIYKDNELTKEGEKFFEDQENQNETQKI